MRELHLAPIGFEEGEGTLMSKDVVSNVPLKISAPREFRIRYL